MSQPRCGWVLLASMLVCCFPTAQAVEQEIGGTAAKVVFTAARVEERDRHVKSNDFIATKVNVLTDLASDPQQLENGYIVELDHKDLGRWKYVPLPIHFERTRDRSARPHVFLPAGSLASMADRLVGPI